MKNIKNSTIYYIFSVLVILSIFILPNKTFANLGRPNLAPPTSVCVGTPPLQPNNILKWPEAKGAIYYIIYRDGALYSPLLSGSSRSWTDLTPLEGVKYNYQLLAGNSDETILSDPPATLSTNYCKPKFTIETTPEKQVVMAGQSTSFDIKVNSFGSFDLSKTPVNLSASDTSSGTNFSFDPSVIDDHTSYRTSKMTVATTNEKTSYGTHTITISASAPGSSVDDQHATIILTIPRPLEIKGDVYSQKNISNLYVTPGSVISANGSITDTSGTDYKIADYNPVNLVKWALISEKMRQMTERLEKEYSTEFIPDTISGSFDFNAEGNSTTINPDGKVLYRNGRLIIGETTIYNRGTIIVNGSVTIKGNIKYADENASLGIIVKEGNDLTIESTVDMLQGAYFVFGKIEVE